MVEQFRSCGSLFHLHFQAPVKERHDFWAEFVLVLHLGLSIGSDEVEGSQRCFIEVRRFALYHLDDHDSKAPDVYFVAVVLPVSKETSWIQLQVLFIASLFYVIRPFLITCVE